MTISTEEQKCYCGKSLHYSDPRMRRYVDSLIRMGGEKIRVTCNEVTYLVPRHYIALHGIKGEELSTLGFEVVE